MFMTPIKDITAFLCIAPTTISEKVRAHRISDWYHKGTFCKKRTFVYDIILSIYFKNAKQRRTS